MSKHYLLWSTFKNFWGKENTFIKLGYIHAYTFSELKNLCA